MKHLFKFLFLFLLLTFLFIAKAESTFKEGQCILQAAKVCIDSGERNVDGFQIEECWKYKEVFRCSGKEENNCAAVEANRGCIEIKGDCKVKSPTGLCNYMEKLFACGNKDISENAEVKVISSEFKVLKDEKDLSVCDPEIKNKYCEIAEENCIEKGEIRNINGKEVYKDCWKWDRKYNCRTDTQINECKALQDKGCIEKQRECIHNEDGRCEHYVVKYECEQRERQELDCVASKFCVGDLCEEQRRNTNTNFGLAASYLSVLAQVQKDGERCGCNKEKDLNCKLEKVEEEKCKLFKGQKFVCSRKTGSWNCCSQKGLIKPLLGCNAHEKELALRNKGNLCTFVGSWREKGLLGLKSFITKKSYCCFNSQLARIIQEQGRKQLGIGWGDKKAPDCRPLTLSEIQRIDFSKINFGEMYHDLQNKAQANFEMSKKDIENKLKGYQSNTVETQNILKEKIQRFYGK